MLALTSTPKLERISQPAQSRIKIGRMHRDDSMSETGAYYIVPNKHGPGKTVVRRPHPPPTSPPLDDDFDAFTQGGTTTRGPETEWGTRARNSVAATSPPLDDDFDAITYTVPGRDTLADPSEWNTGVRAERGGYDVTKNRQRTAGSLQRGRNISQSGFEKYGEYGQYMDDMEKMFGGGSVDLELSVRPDEGLGGGHQLGRMRSVSSASGQAGKKSMTGIGHRSRLGFGETHPTINGPKKGQDYEMINRRVIEDGPERTVTISTWREEVANEASPEVEMSVYYVDADEYAISPSMHSDRYPKTDRGSSQQDGNDHMESRRMTSGRLDTGPLSEKAYPTRRFSDPAFIARPEGARSPQNRTANRSGSPLARNYTPHDRVYNPEKTPPRTSTPVRERTSPTANRLPRRNFTPTKLAAASLTFHPTDSGSTISSVVSDDILSTSFQKILSSCQPSLAHVLPILASLGITREEHLRAVAMLTEETRDREVKEEALRKGMTVMEWAILLDVIKRSVT